MKNEEDESCANKNNCHVTFLVRVKLSELTKEYPLELSDEAPRK